jgi:hypothetical protein
LRSLEGQTELVEGAGGCSEFQNRASTAALLLR